MLGGHNKCVLMNLINNKGNSSAVNIITVMFLSLSSEATKPLPYLLLIKNESHETYFCKLSVSVNLHLFQLPE